MKKWWKSRYKSERFSMIMAVVIVVVFFLPWFSLDGKHRTIIGLFSAADAAGGMPQLIMNNMGIDVQFWSEELAGSALIMNLVCKAAIVLPILYVTYGVLRLFRKAMHSFEIGLLVADFAFAYIMLTLSLQFQRGDWIYCAIFLVAGLEFIIRKLIEDIEEAERENRRITLKIKWRRFKQAFIDWKHREHKKNSPLLYMVVLKNFKSNWKNFVLFFSSASVAVCLVFSTVAVEAMLGSVYSISSLGLDGILEGAIKLIAVVSIFMMAFTLKYYISSRLKDYSVFITIGIQSRTLALFIAIEYIGSLLISTVIGLLSGNVVALIFRQIFSTYYAGEVAHIPFPGLGVYASAAWISLLIFIASAFVNYQVLNETDLSNMSYTAVKKEKIGSKMSGLYFPLGMLLAVGMIGLYTRRFLAENIVMLALFFLGMYMALRYGGGIILDMIRKKEKFYYRNMLSFNNFYYRFKKNISNVFVLFAVHFFVLFYFAMQILQYIPQEPIEQNFPYDAVGMVDTLDEEGLGQIVAKYEAEATVIPMLRLGTPDCTRNIEDTESSWSIPQGQHIGISEASYEQLNHKKLELSENEIFISYQQDKGDYAHALDFALLESTPLIRVGGVAPGYELILREKVFQSDHVLVGEERNPFIGNFVGGFQENVVVYSEDEFSRLSAQKVGVKSLILMNVPEKAREAASKELRAFIKTNTVSTEESEMAASYDQVIKSLYEKDTKVQEIKAERVLQMFVHAFILLALVFSGLFILFVRTAADIPDMQKKEVFLKCLGMRKKERRKTMVREIYLVATLPIVLAVVFGGIFTFITLKLRFYTGVETGVYLRREAIVLGVYLLIQAVGTIVLKCHMIKKVEEVGNESN